jgi:hypothetical protein
MNNSPAVLNNNEYWSSSDQGNLFDDDASAEGSDNTSAISKQQKMMTNSSLFLQEHSLVLYLLIVDTTQVNDTMIAVSSTQHTPVESSTLASPTEKGTTLSPKQRKTKNNNRDEQKPAAIGEAEDEVKLFWVTEENIHTMNLVMLTLLVHSTPDCLVHQPAENNRTLRISDLRDKKIINAMTGSQFKILWKRCMFFFMK